MKGQLALVRVQQAIRNILTVTHLLPLFSLYDSIDAAVKAMGGHAHGTAPAGAAAPQVKRKPLGAKR
jgi:hypothetical protein